VLQVLTGRGHWKGGDEQPFKMRPVLTSLRNSSLNISRASRRSPTCIDPAALGSRMKNIALSDKYGLNLPRCLEPEEIR
jgi:hypothetical protein